MYNEFQEKIGYTFKRETLLSQALCHASCDERTEEGIFYNNERLEFLGDRVLGLVIAHLVFEQCPDVKEGLLAKRHTALVRQDALAEVARTLEIGKLLKMSKGEESSGGRNKSSILSDAMEAIIAAIYIDGGFSGAEKFIQTHWAPLVEKAKEIRLKDAKSQLQEFLQENKKPLPVYELAAIEGLAHCRMFVIKVVTDGYGEAVGRGTTKRAAQQEAALELLKELGED